MKPIKLNKTFLTSLGILALSLVFPAVLQAAIDDEADTMDYDAIVNELSRPRIPKVKKATIVSTSSLDSSMIHMGAGYTNVFQNIDMGSGKQITVDQPGLQVSLGIDLFSEHFSAEGSMRSYSDQEYAQNTVGIKEFDLKFYYRTIVAPKLTLRAGGGLSARYLTLMKIGKEFDYTTPSSLLAMGLDVYLSEGFSVGGEVAMQSTLVTDTPDQRSYNAIIRVDTHF